MDEWVICKISGLAPQIRELEEQAVAEGFRFLTRLIAEWESGANRFDQQGECLLGVFRNGRLIAVGGLSSDPFSEPGVGRLRRVYVAPASRGQNVGKALVQQLLELASGHFRVVRLSTDTPEGAAFYLRCGFQPIHAEHATHMKSLVEIT
jgi:GNAT superfamily N-acetyltransferase